MLSKAHAGNWCFDGSHGRIVLAAAEQSRWLGLSSAESAREGTIMTNKITVVASQVRVNDHVYNGTGTNSHPTFAWETVTEIRQDDGLILLITGNQKGPHGEFWLEPDEEIVVIRYPEPIAAVTPSAKPGAKH